MHLLIDNSNTRTKLALAHEDGLSSWRAVIPTSELTKETLSEALKDQQYERATICSVVPKAAALLNEYLKVPTHQITHRSDLPIVIDYPRPEQIGADRLANSAAVAALFGTPAIVIDFGTAVTFDVISQEASYLGGAIAPGTASLRDYLHRRTALLPAIQLEEPSSAIGKSTEDAMQVGAVIGYRGLIREILTEIRKELGGQPHLVATGGDAALIAQGLSEIKHIDRDLTLKGIELVGQKNHSA